MLKDDCVQDFQVTQVNKGGVCGQVVGVEAFMPYSKLSSGMRGDSGVRGGQDAHRALIGRTLKVKILTVRSRSFHVACHTFALW